MTIETLIDPLGIGATHIVTGADAQAFTVSGLAAFATQPGFIGFKGRWEIVCNVAAGAPQYYIRINNITADTRTRGLAQTGAAGIISVDNLGFFVMGCVTPTNLVTVDFELYDLPTGRGGKSESAAFSSTGPAFDRSLWLKSYQLDQSAWSTIVFHCDTAAQQKINTRLRLYAQYSRPAMYL